MSDETKPGADIVADAREWLARYFGRVTTHSDGCHRWHDACLIARLAAECDRLRSRLSIIGDYPAADNAASGDNGAAANSPPNHRTDIEYVRSLEARLEELRSAADQADAEYRKEIERLRLTGMERTAIEWAIMECESMPTTLSRGAADTLRSLLSRIGDCPVRKTGGDFGQQPTLTDKEREAVLAMACHCDTRCGSEWVRLSATLRSLLERTK